LNSFQKKYKCQKKKTREKVSHKGNVNQNDKILFHPGLKRCSRKQKMTKADGDVEK
jgi:hypothetical protein